MGANLSLVAAQLEGREYLLGDTFSVADAYLFVCLRWSKILGIELEQWPVIAQYMVRIKARSSVGAALASEAAKK